MIKKCVYFGKEINHIIDFVFFNNNVVSINGNENFEYSKNLLVLFLNDIKINKAEEQIKKINKLNYTNFIFMPFHLKNIFIEKKHKVLFYPIEINNFEYFLQNSVNDGYFFGDLYMDGNYLTNNKNNLKVYFTETQANIFNTLMKNKVVEKSKLKKDVLNFNSQLDTKSLESHLSRLRKKIQEIDSSVSIISTNRNYVSLVKHRVGH